MTEGYRAFLHVVNCVWCLENEDCHRAEDMRHSYESTRDALACASLLALVHTTGLTHLPSITKAAYEHADLMMRVRDE